MIVYNISSLSTSTPMIPKVCFSCKKGIDQLTTDKTKRKLCHMYIILFPVWAGIKCLYSYSNS